LVIAIFFWIIVYRKGGLSLVYQSAGGELKK